MQWVIGIFVLLGIIGAINEAGAWGKVGIGVLVIVVISKILEIKGKKFLENYKYKGQTINLNDLPDGFVFEGNLDISNKNLTELPDLSKVIVKGNFNCSHNCLTSLKGCPQKVGGNFNCSYNQLTSLKGCPQKVGGLFVCRDNQLTSLENLPKEMEGSVVYDRNPIRDSSVRNLASVKKILDKYNNLPDGFVIEGDIDLSNKNLTELPNLSKVIVKGNFYCHGNHLTSLKGAP